MCRALFSRLFILLLPAFVMLGCMNHDPPVSKELIFQTPLYVKYGDTTLIDATSGYPINFTILDTYFAELISPNYIYGKKVGETELSVESNGTEGLVRVVVMPKYGFFHDPILDFSLSKQQLLRELRAFSQVYITEYGTEVIAHLHPHSAMVTRYYIQDSTISAVRVSTHIKNVIGVYQTIEERYQFLSYIDGIRYYINKSTMDDATIVVGVLHSYVKEYAAILYLPVIDKWDNNKLMLLLKSKEQIH